MKKFYFLLVLALAFTPVNSAYARGGGSSSSWLLGIDLSYFSSKAEAEQNSGGTSTSESAVTSYDLSLGYLMGSSIYFGVMHSTKNTKTELSTSTPAAATGLSLGYVFNSGIHFTGTYFLTATDGDLKNGSGYEVDFGWRSFVSSSFFVGAKMAYRSLKYTEVSGYKSLTHTGVTPYISIGFGF